MTAEAERLTPLVDAYRSTAGRTMMKPYDFDMVLRMGVAIREHPEAMGLIEGAAVEVSLEAVLNVDTAMGKVAVPIRGRLDIAGAGYVSDVKTADDLTPDVFDRAVLKYEYHRQLAFYDALRCLSGDLTVIDPDERATLIVCETPEGPLAPVRVSVVAISSEYLAIGMKKNMEGLASLAGTFLTDSWSPQIRGVRKLGPPRWLY